MYTAENLAKSNIQGIGPHLVKLKENQLWADANHDIHIRINIGGESASPTNPEKGRAGKHKKTNADRLKYESTGNHKCASAWHWMNLRIGL